MVKALLTLSILFLCSLPALALGLSGKVLNFQTEKGKPDVLVSVYSGDSLQESFKSETDSEGSYIVSGLKKNSAYTVRAFYSNDSVIIPRSVSITTSKSGDVTSDFTYYPKYSVSGRITSGAGPAKGLNVSFKSGEPFYDYVSVETDDQGDYAAEGLIYGQKYDLSVYSNFQVYGITGDPSVTIGQNNIKNAEIIPVFYGTGRAFDSSTGQGLEDIGIKAVSSDKKHEVSAKTAGDGTFILSGLRYGENYTVTADSLTGFEQPLEMQTGTVRSTARDLNFPFVKK